MASPTYSAVERLEIVDTGRRRRWSAAEKRRIVLESLSGPRLISATARRHGLSRALLVAWRRALMASESRTEEGVPAPAFAAAFITPDSERAGTALPCVSSASAQPQMELVLLCGRRMIVDAGIDIEAVIKLARALEALR